MNNQNVILEFQNYIALRINNKAVVIVPKEAKEALNVIVDLDKGVQTKNYIDTNQVDQIFQLSGVKDMVDSGSEKNIYIIPLIDRNLLDMQLEVADRERNYQVVFGAIGSIVSDPMLDPYIEKKVETTTRIVTWEDDNRYVAFCEWLEKNREVPGHNYIEGISYSSLQQKFQTEKSSTLETPNSVISEVVTPVAVDSIGSVQPVSNGEQEVVSSVVAEPVSGDELPNDTALVNSDVIKEPEVAVSLDKTLDFSNLNTGQSSVDPVVSQPAVDVVPDAETTQIMPSITEEPEIHSAGGENVEPATLENTSSQGNTAMNGSIASTVDSNGQVAQNETMVASSNPKASVIGGLGRAAFVKFPVFLLTIMAIGAIGIFVGKMFYMYLSQ